MQFVRDLFDVLTDVDPLRTQAEQISTRISNVPVRGNRPAGPSRSAIPGKIAIPPGDDTPDRRSSMPMYEDRMRETHAMHYMPNTHTPMRPSLIPPVTLLAPPSIAPPLTSASGSATPYATIARPAAHMQFHSGMREPSPSRFMSGRSSRPVLPAFGLTRISSQPPQPFGHGSPSEYSAVPRIPQVWNRNTPLTSSTPQLPMPLDGGRQVTSRVGTEYGAPDKMQTLASHMAHLDAQIHDEYDATIGKRVHDTIAEIENELDRDEWQSVMMPNAPAWQVEQQRVSTQARAAQLQYLKQVVKDCASRTRSPTVKSSHGLNERLARAQKAFEHFTRESAPEGEAPVEPERQAPVAPERQAPVAPERESPCRERKFQTPNCHPEEISDANFRCFTSPNQARSLPLSKHYVPDMRVCGEHGRAQELSPGRNANRVQSPEKQLWPSSDAPDNVGPSNFGSTEKVALEARISELERELREAQKQQSVLQHVQPNPIPNFQDDISLKADLHRQIGDLERTLASHVDVPRPREPEPAPQWNLLRTREFDQNSASQPKASFEDRSDVGAEEKVLEVQDALDHRLMRMSELHQELEGARHEKSSFDSNVQSTACGVRNLERLIAMQNQPEMDRSHAMSQPEKVEFQEDVQKGTVWDRLHAIRGNGRIQPRVLEPGRITQPERAYRGLPTLEPGRQAPLLGTIRTNEPSVPRSVDPLPHANSTTFSVAATQFASPTAVSRGSPAAASMSPVSPSASHWSSTALGIRVSRPDMSMLPSANMAYMVQVETSGWNSVRWDNGYSLLHWCSKRGLTDICLYMIELQADVSLQDSKGKTAVDYARENAHYDLCASLGEVLRMLPASPRASPRPERSTSWASPRQDFVPRPDVSMLPSDNLTYLKQVEENGWDSVKWDNGYTLLHWCAKRGLTDVCLYVVSLNADPEAEDYGGKTPVEYALRGGYDDLVQKLTCMGSGGAPITSRNSESQAMIEVNVDKQEEWRTSREFLTTTGLQRDERVENAIELMEDHGWEKMRWRNEFTLLHWAAREGFVMRATEFLRRGADLEARDVRGKTATDYAVENHHLDVLTAFEVFRSQNAINIK